MTTATRWRKRVIGWPANRAPCPSTTLRRRGLRNRLIAAGSGVAVLALGVGIAFAQQPGENIYEVDLATATPAGKGSAAKPKPAKLGFGYEVSAQGGLRPTAIRQYRIAPEGLVTYPKLFKACTFDQAAQLPEPAASCDKAAVGKGRTGANRCLGPGATSRA